MLNKTIFATAAITLGLAFNVAALAETTPAEIDDQALAEKFNRLVPFNVTAVEQSPIAGLKQIVTERGVFYMAEDGKHFIAGSIHRAEPGMANLTQIRLAQEGAKQIAALKDSFITFEAPNAKYEVVVFYDASCPFCTRLHNEMSQYHANGITVHYAGWPRTGIRNQRNQLQYSSGYNELMHIWCNENPKAAMNRSAEGRTLPQSVCDTEIEAHFNLGQQLGVQGTPAVYTLDGREVARGYQPATQMLQSLESL